MCLTLSGRLTNAAVLFVNKRVMVGVNLRKINNQCQILKMTSRL